MFRYKKLDIIPFYLPMYLCSLSLISCISTVVDSKLDDQKENGEVMVMVVQRGGAEVTMAITAGEMNAGEMNAGEMNAGEMTAGEMTAGEMTAGEMAAGEMAAGEMTAGEMTAGEMTAGEMTAGEMAAGEMAAGEMAAGEMAAGEMAAGEMAAGEMAAGEMTAGEMTAGEMAAGEMAAGEMAAGEMAAGEEMAGSEVLQEDTGTCDQPLRPRPDESTTINTCVLEDRVDVCGSTNTPEVYLLFEQNGPCSLQLEEGVIFKGGSGRLCDGQVGGSCFMGINTINFSGPASFILEPEGLCRPITVHYTCR